MSSRRKKVVILLVIVVALVAIVWGILRYPGRQPLTEEEVRQLIMEYPGGHHLDVKNETIEFLSVELVPVEDSPFYEDFKNWEDLPDRVWVVEYECEARVWGPAGTPPPPFTRKFVQVIINAYTGRKIRLHAENIE